MEIKKRAPKGTVRGFHPCPKCGTIYENRTGKKKFCSKECWPKPQRTCPGCNVDISHLYVNAKFCSIECGKKVASAKRDVLKKQNLNADEYVECKICSESYKQLVTHLKHKHNTTISEYKTKFPGAPTISVKTAKKLSDNVSGEKNVWYNHGGKLSPFSKNNTKISEEQRKQNHNRAHKSREVNGNITTTLEYFMKKTNDIEEAKKMLAKRQTTFSLEICIEKYGEEEGLKRWQKRQEKWHANFKKQNYSKISQELFFKLREKLAKDLVVHFAECKELGKNDEFIFPTKCGRVFKLDFYIPSLHKIIEFDGTYWHNRNKVSDSSNKTRDEIRDSQILATDSRLKILHVKEHDYRNNKEDTIQKCLDFLKS